LTESGPGITIWIGGDAATFDEVRPVLDVIADHVTYCGGVGHAQITKLVNNLVTQSLVVALGEALTLGVAEGVPLEVLRVALRYGTAQSRVLDEMLPFGVFQGDHRPGLRLDLAIKDLDLVRDLARRRGSDLPLSEKTREAYLEAAARGWGGLSSHAVLRLSEERAGTELRSMVPDAPPETDPLA
jgi:3-hydroxyisobutyrate dehydrogenase-like beta-hydroxyacid dehydrogenase